MSFDLDVGHTPINESMRTSFHLSKILVTHLLKKSLFHFRVENVLNRVESLVHYSIEMMSFVKLLLLSQTIASCILINVCSSSRRNFFVWS